MKKFGGGGVHEKLIDRLERQERQQAFQRDKFFKFKLPEIHTQLSQTLLMEKIIETDNAGAVSDLILNGLRKILRSTEFDFKYFIAPIRDLVPRPNPISLYMTQYILEVSRVVQAAPGRYGHRLSPERVTGIYVRPH